MAMLSMEVGLPGPGPGEEELSATAQDIVKASDGLVSGDGGPNAPASPMTTVSNSCGDSIRNSGGPSPLAVPNGVVTDCQRAQEDFSEKTNTSPPTTFITTHRPSSNNIVITPVATTDVHETPQPAPRSPTSSSPGVNVTSAASVATSNVDPTVAIATIDKQDDSAAASLGYDSCDSVTTAGEDSASGDDIRASSASLPAATRRKKSSPHGPRARKGSKGSAVSPSRWRRSWPWSRFRRKRRDKGEFSVSSFPVS